MILDRRQFGELYNEYYNRYVIVARRYVRDREVAHDIVMDCFMSLWLNREVLDTDKNVPAYLMVMIKNRCLDWLDSEQRHLRTHRDIHDLQVRLNEENARSLRSLDPESVFASEVIEIVHKQMEAMPELTRRVFAANRFDNKTYAEIAEELGITQRRVTTEMQRALSILRDALSDYLPTSLLLWFLDIK